MRFEGNRDISAYTSTALDAPPAAIPAAAASEASAERAAAASDGACAAPPPAACVSAPTEPCCPLCLGLLHASVDAASVASLVQEVKAQGYETPSFAIALSLPTVLVLRERSARIYLRRGCEGGGGPPTSR